MRGVNVDRPGRHQARLVAAGTVREQQALFARRRPRDDPKLAQRSGAGGCVTGLPPRTGDFSASLCAEVGRLDPQLTTNARESVWYGSSPSVVFATTRYPAIRLCVYMRPGSGQPSEPSFQVTCSARVNTTALSATPKRFAASATTARRTSPGTAAIPTGVPAGSADMASALGGMRDGGALPVRAVGATPVLSGGGFSAATAPNDTKTSKIPRFLNIVLAPFATVYKRVAIQTGVP